MRAYEKSATAHRFCVYLTEDETARLLEELEDSNAPEWAEVVPRFRVNLGAVFERWEDSQSA